MLVLKRQRAIQRESQGKKIETLSKDARIHSNEEGGGNCCQEHLPIHVHESTARNDKFQSCKFRSGFLT